MSNYSKTFKAVMVLTFAFALLVGSSANAAITTFLKPGSRGQQVKELQQFLNGCSAETMVASTGYGSAGMETTYFGPATTKAVKAFQTKMGLVADALVGAKTRAAIAAGCGSNNNNNNNNNNVGGAVSMDASGTPAPSTILIATQSSANLLSLKFTGNYTVTNLKLMRTGISTNSALSNIYLFDGSTRLTDAASVNNMGEITFNQPSGLFMVNGSRTITVRADIASGTAGQTVGVSFVSAMAGTSALTGSATGYNYGIATNPSSMSAVAFTGSVTPDGATLNTGANVTLWQSTASVTNNDVYLDRIALRQTGSAQASAFANFKLYVNGVQVATATGLDANNYVTFVPTTPVLMTAGSKIVRVDADIISGASRTVHMSLRTAADVGLRDSQLGVNISATGLPEHATSASTISGASGGTLTIEKDISSPSTNIVLGGSDVLYGVYKATAYGEPIKIETLTLGMDSSDASFTAIRNGRLMIGGVQYGSTASILEAGTSYTVNYTVNPGTPVMIEIRGDVYDSDGTNNATAGDTITVSIDAGSSNAQKIDSLGTLSVPGSAVDANTLTVGTTSMTLSKNATYANQTVALPAANFKVGSWNLSGSSIEDILVTTLSFDVDEVTVSADDFNESDMTNMYVVVKSGSTIVAQPSPLSTVSATDNNFSINYTVAKNTSVTIELYANLGSTVTAAEKVKTDLTVTGTALVSGSSVTATSADTDGQTLTAGTASITVSKDASSPVAAIVYDNQTVTTLAAKFDAVTAGYNITDMTVTVGASANTVVQSVMIYDGATLVASGPMTTSTTAVFNGLSVNIPANTSKVLTVKLQLGSIGVGAGTSGATITTSIAAATDVVYTNTSTGVSTSSSTEEAGTATGSTMYAYASIPTVNRVALPTTVLASGTQVLAKFDVVSNGGTVAWKQVLFDITKSAAPTITSVELWDVTNGGNTQVTAAEVFQNDTNTDAACNASDTACELLISVGTNADDNVEEQVSGTKTYEVRATIGGTLAAANSINVSIQSNLAHVSSAAYTSVDNDTSVDDATFVWSDISAQSHDTGTTDWVNENLVRVLPTSTWTMTYPN